jgi:hypothetical protein
VLIVIVAVLARNRPGNRLGRVIVDYVTLEKSSRSITNTLYCIKQKNKAILPTLQPKLDRPTKNTKRQKTIVNRDLTRGPKKTNKRILEENSLDLSTRSLQRLLREENYSINTSKKKPLLNYKKQQIV